jgi:hypothetical protein
MLGHECPAAVSPDPKEDPARVHCFGCRVQGFRVHRSWWAVFEYWVKGYPARTEADPRSKFYFILNRSSWAVLWYPAQAFFVSLLDRFLSLSLSRACTLSLPPSLPPSLRLSLRPPPSLSGGCSGDCDLQLHCFWLAQMDSWLGQLGTRPDDVDARPRGRGELILLEGGYV